MCFDTNALTLIGSQTFHFINVSIGAFLYGQPIVLAF